MNSQKHSKKLRMLIALITLLALLLPTFSSYAAAGGGGNVAEPMTIGTISISFTARSSTDGYAHIYAHSIGYPTFITSKATLQSAPSGSSSYTDVSGVSPSIYTVYNKVSIDHTCSFPITSTKNYRIKVEITDEVNGKQSTITCYKNLTR